MTRVNFISALLILVALLCLILAFSPSYSVRFIEAQFNYLFIGILYIVLLSLAVLRILLIKDVHVKWFVFVIALMLVVFPCLFIFSVALQNYYRVQNNAGSDDLLQLVDQTKDGTAYVRTYKTQDVGFMQLYGFGVVGRRGLPTSQWSSNSQYAPTKKFKRKELDLNQYLKLVYIIE